MNQQGQAQDDPTASWDSDPEQRKRRLEAVLFMAREPISARKLSQFAGLEDGTQARTLVSELNGKYNELGKAFHIKRIAGGYQLLTRPQFSKWLRQFEHIPKSRRLSRPAMETLAIVAYRQPVIKADIEAIRGVSSGEMLRQLLEQGLVRISGRSEELGRPFLYSTSREFLTEFGLKNLEELPRSADLVGQGLPNWDNSDQISDQLNLSKSPIQPSDETSSSQDLQSTQGEH